jgi:hypothetical protein
VSRAGDRFQPSDVAREYLDRRRPYYLGPSLYGTLMAPLPPQLTKGQAIRRYSRFTHSLRDRLRYLRGKPQQFGRPEQLAAQHRRNLPNNTAAVATGLFAGVRHLVDIGGGSGAFAIPLALASPSMRITLVDLPRALPHVGPFLRPYGLEHQIEQVGFNLHDTPWPLAGCDAVLFGNILHFCDDDECLDLLRESHRLLPRGGRVFVHEMLWNDEKDGPILTALWNFWMATISSGRQRTQAELVDLFTRASFTTTAVKPTLGGFTLLVATAGPSAQRGASPSRPSASQ